MATGITKPQHIAQTLLARIADAGLGQGETLATEAGLLDEFGVSRPTLREGLRILESLGVLQQRPGPGGGLVVRRPDIDMLTLSLSVYLRFNHVPFAAVLQAREAIEPALAAEAARQGTQHDFADLQASIDRMAQLGDDAAAFLAENRTFHDLVARASGNGVLQAFWGAMSALAQGDMHGVRYAASHRRHVIAAHRRILEACLRRDAAASAAAMADHVGELEGLVHGRYRHLLGAPTVIPGLQAPSPAPVPRTLADHR